MKKKLIAVGIAAALGSMAGAANAAMTLNQGGIGNINIIPYYSVQNGNNTLLSITNTDTTNGKVVKVRFRGAEWSDDVFDFQLFLSPGDVWTGAVSANGNLAKLTSASDKTCTLPTTVGQAGGNNFITTRLWQNPTTGTKEGYIEIITMADIPASFTTTATVTPTSANVFGITPGTYNPTTGQTNPLYTTTKHVNGVAPCSATLLNNLLQDNQVESYATAATAANRQNENFTAGSVVDQALWMTAPTQNSLMSYAVVINVEQSKAFTFPAAAFDTTGATVKQYFRQSNDAIFNGTTKPFNLADALDYTQDRIFYPQDSTADAIKSATTGATILEADAGVAGAGLGTALPMFQFDMPDLSTPMETAAGLGVEINGVTVSSSGARVQRDNMLAVMQKSAVRTEYFTDVSLLGATDVVFNQPIRRFFYWYGLDTATDASPTTVGFASISDGTTTKTYDIFGETQSVYQPLVGKTNSVTIGGAIFNNREEQSNQTPTEIVISPQLPGQATTYFLQGEVAVWSLNTSGGATAATGAELTTLAVGVPGDYTSGWAWISTTSTGASTRGGSVGDGSAVSGFVGATTGALPVIGFTATNLFNATANGGTNYGLALPLRY